MKHRSTDSLWPFTRRDTRILTIMAITLAILALMDALIR